ncbi:MAG TPA: hypothetical protein VE287_04730 [Actinopolymorphaceae bacterium]|nr:hypothetical protein [Actinopolymorphaceae bacterium]
MTTFSTLVVAVRRDMLGVVIHRTSCEFSVVAIDQQPGPRGCAGRW